MIERLPYPKFIPYLQPMYTLLPLPLHPSTSQTYPSAILTPALTLYALQFPINLLNHPVLPPLFPCLPPPRFTHFTSLHLPCGVALKLIYLV